MLAEFQQIIQQFISVHILNSTLQQCLFFVKGKAMSKELDKIPHTKGARHNLKQPSTPEHCLEGTCTVVLERIWCWIAPTISVTAAATTSDTAVNLSSD